MPASPELREDIGHASWGRSLGLATPQFRESVKKKGAPGGGGARILKRWRPYQGVAA